MSEPDPTLRADLTGRTAFVTGASSGLGLHFAGVLARAGCTVAVGARRAGMLRAVADEIHAGGGRAFPVAIDVVSEESVRQAAAEVEREAGAIDVLVNCAGITHSGAILDQTEQQWDAVIDTNLKGAFLVGTEVGRRMRAAQRRGSIINIGSILGLRQAGLVGPYAVSKAGLIQLTKVMAFELARFDIRVNAILPGYFETEINREFWASSAAAAMLKRIPQRRAGELKDLDGPLLLLASESSRFMTGSTITVDGGHMISTL
jgi:NAD(P)-dependent dehydrogenase (short-subunit alcohol dehydrogenase family)